MSALFTASVNLVETIHDLQDHLPELRCLNLKEIEAAIEAAIELEKKEILDRKGEAFFNDR